MCQRGPSQTAAASPLHPPPCGEPLLTHASTGHHPTLAGSFGSASYGVTASFLWILMHAGFCLCPPVHGVAKSRTRLSDYTFTFQAWSLCFSQSCGSLVVKSSWASRSDCLGILGPFVGSSGWKAWRWVPNLHNSGRTSFVLLLSSLWVTHCWVWDLILSWLCPSYHLALASSLSLDMGYLLLVGSSILLSMVVQQLVVILCSQRRRWVHILLLHHLKLEVLP